MGSIAYFRTTQAYDLYLKVSGEGRVINFASLDGVAGLLSSRTARQAIRLRYAAAIAMCG